MSEVNSKTWEQQTLEKVALAAVREQRTARRWKIAFRIIWLIIFASIWVYLSDQFHQGDRVGKKPGVHGYTASINVMGEIVSEGQGAMLASADRVIDSLHDAFKDNEVKGIVLRVNSPGGTPVASGRIYDAIQSLRKQYPAKLIYTVVDDLCASGCYYVAVATNKIFVNRASIVGSIGVRMDGFGFTEGMKKLGIERRLITAGEHKGFLDPFSPLDPKQLAFTKNLLQNLHVQFIQAVKTGRGNRLQDNPDIFSGLAWDGLSAINLGLVDGQGTVEYVAKELIKAEEIIDFSYKPTWIDYL